VPAPGYGAHAPAPSQAPAHSLSGSVPDARKAQLPFAPPLFAAEQARQAPAHVVSQQYPSTQLPEAHSLEFAHALPCASFASHDDPLHQNPVTQSASPVQVDLQAVAPQTYGLQDCRPASRQDPKPSHVSATVAVEPVQLARAQAVPPGWRAQARAPLQRPLVPQEAGADAGHSLPESAPSASASQKPARPAWLHRSQVPPQRASQQTPSVQKPLAQPTSATQGWPCASLQAPAAQE
jgi:hypothetical protein